MTANAFYLKQPLQSADSDARPSAFLAWRERNGGHAWIDDCRDSTRLSIVLAHRAMHGRRILVVAPERFGMRLAPTDIAALPMTLLRRVSLLLLRGPGGLSAEWYRLREILTMHEMHPRNSVHLGAYVAAHLHDSDTGCAYLRTLSAVASVQDELLHRVAAVFLGSGCLHGSLRLLAEGVAMSEATLRRRLWEKQGLSPSKFVAILRVLLAHLCAEECNATQAYLAGAVGVRDVRTLEALARRCAGMSRRDFSTVRRTSDASLLHWLMRGGGITRCRAMEA